MNNYDVIVLGTGGVGSAAAFHLAQRGASVLGLDKFSGAHDHGSSHGQTRMIRKAYFEEPDYVPLLHRTYELWRELEELRDEQLYYATGLIEISPPGGSVVPGVRLAARRHNLPVEELDPQDFTGPLSRVRVTRWIRSDLRTGCGIPARRELRYRASTRGGTPGSRYPWRHAGGIVERGRIRGNSSYRGRFVCRRKTGHHCRRLGGKAIGRSRPGSARRAQAFALVQRRSRLPYRSRLSRVFL